MAAGVGARRGGRRAGGAVSGGGGPRAGYRVSRWRATGYPDGVLQGNPMVGGDRGEEGGG